VENAVRRAIQEEDAVLPVTGLFSMEKLIEQRTLQDRMVARLALAFGVVALLLAGLGLYGVLSYGVARRTSEIGIRKALGASPGALVSMILRETSWLLAGGLALGGLLAYGSLRSIRSLLFGLSPADPGVLSTATVVLCGVGLMAALLPALRASRVDALVAIRHE
jgi:ABC-type antimicrobial peptide transport system permease subunit